MKVIIIGAGIMGLSTAWALQRMGAEVTIVEQGGVPNPLGSSVDQHRLIRYPYGAARGYTRMVHAAYDAWERVWTDLGVRLYIETGTLVLSGPGDEWAAQCLASLAPEGIAQEPIAPDALSARFPFLRPENLVSAFGCPHGGLLRADAILGRLKTHAMDRGLRLLSRRRAEAVDASTGNVRLADGEILTADRVLVAAGPWTARLLPELGGVARPSRQTVVYLTPPPEHVAAWYHAPMLLELGGTAGFYAVPPRVCGDGMRLGLKVGDHTFGATADPDAAREPSAEEIEAVVAPARRRLADGARYRIAEARTCFYDVAPEERFQFVGAGGRVFAICGSSGHGFKFGPCLGEAMAAVLLERVEFVPVQAWIAGEMTRQPPHIMALPASESASSG